MASAMVGQGCLQCAGGLAQGDLTIMAGTQRLRVFLTALAFLAAGAAPALAQQAPATADAGLSAVARKFPALADFERDGGLVEYIGRHGSLEGFVLISADKSIKTVYATPDNTLVMGILVDANGTNLTAPQLAAYRQRLNGDQSALPDATQSSVSKAEKFYAETEKAAWVKVGADSAPYIYVYMNVNCDHCKAMFSDLLPLVRANKIQLRLIPFGAAPANREGGAALLSVADPLSAWQAYIKGDTGALAAAKITGDAAAKIDANTALVAGNKVKGTPFTIYRRPANGVISVISGRPQNTLALLADLLPPDLPSAPEQAGEVAE